MPLRVLKENFTCLAVLRKSIKHYFACCDNVLAFKNIVYDLGCLKRSYIWRTEETFDENVSESACHLLNSLSNITSLNST